VRGPACEIGHIGLLDCNNLYQSYINIPNLLFPHFPLAKSYPATMLSRSCNYFTKEILEYVSL